ncbi:nucleotide exchange factor GrpE [Candidatus Falkowbacteria bacterium RIFOXYD2_FULL_35_9]|uniref:Protein GrpE n=1 Tax=Candidatus Falkowbacteria bacterium RIFOXYC2_FULL_36_12 TaxID=1798002 RepID=A0A1F5SYG6_9BACT|nr:MAG: nucleotide exchange factor GrpE [Candidatus Falkowbacteria bacterium RIFOXYB2_FULL_35_7]OGF31765.1 MAG: nucleotide exchange factor GrpE [Candidatus Falkowbacteria bacterium RIFOXYC2_FULL_36_12]OGF33107.1 MAG: nucleotide exchange factor GrpE [Candidatus Falkowbacteria bacterium RIFOXYA2_FULL_35_8]OGF48085.1 MAG: nucleotide exchange factor GrpE [Candidatus Falkowbacteria bacterium RIFOXYD2_FULL_35_9]
MKEKKDKKDTLIEKLKQEAGENLAGWQRAKADYENLTKENARDRLEYIKYANANLIMELLPIYDNFKLAFNAVPEADKTSSWVIGLQHIMKQMQDFLQSNGIEEIQTYCQNFDPELHEAVESVADANFDNGQIIKTIKSGYKLHHKIIQVAKVVVCENKK